jgi:hypothetical protein
VSDDIEEAQRLAKLLGFPPGPDAYFYIKLFEMLLDMKARLEKLEGKLAKATKALQKVRDFVRDLEPYADQGHTLASALHDACVILNELEGDWT